MRVLPCGERALLVEVDDLEAVLAFDAAMQSSPLPGLIDVVPAARTVLLTFSGVRERADATRTIAAMTAASGAIRSMGPLVQIPVRYDGEDLAEVAHRLEMTTEELIEAHSRCEWTVAFCGFAPGFAYLTGPDERLAGVGRRASPRTRVPAGSVALAGGFSAVYPTASPGGWHLLGRTDLRVFDVDRDPPALLTPGTRVRFVRQ